MTTSPARCSRPLIYVAGPYTIPDPVINVRRACEIGELIWTMGGVPLVPHLTIAWHLAHPHDIEYWYALDLAQIAHCDALYRFPGESTGADREVEEAERLGLPVFPGEPFRMQSWIEMWARSERLRRASSGPS